MVKGKKGVSPVIATVLLIGMVVVVGLIVFVWVGSLTQEAITKFGGENIELACDDVSFDAGYFGGELAVSNSGTVPLYSLMVKIVETGSFRTESIRDLSDWPIYGIDQGGAFSGNLNLGNSNEVVLIPVLIGNSDSGMKSFTCDESNGVTVQVA